MDMKNKKELRKEILDIRSSLSDDDVKLHSEAICSRLQDTEQYRRAENVCLYMPIRNEVDVTLIMERARADGKTVWLPKVRDGVMHFHLYGEETALISGAFGIREPDSENVLVPGGEALVVMPGAVFSEKRDRIGYGGGYYDRFLEKYGECMTAAVCYDFQITDGVPAEEHDIRPALVVSEKRVIE